MPTLAQDISNPCDAIEYQGEVQDSAGLTQTELAILIAERNIQRNYVNEDYNDIDTWIRTAFYLDPNWAMGYFYRACVSLQDDDTEAAINDFLIFLDLTDDTELANDVRAFNNVTGNSSGTAFASFNENPVTFPETLENYNTGHRAVVEEISEALGLNFGGQVILNDASADIVIQGDNYFVEFIPAAQIENFIMGGRINFTIPEDDNDMHACGLMARTQRESSTSTFSSYIFIRGFVFIGFEENGRGLLAQNTEDTGGSFGVESEEEYSLEDSNNVLLIVLNNLATVYIDGELMVENFRLDSMPGGAFALTLFSNGETNVECGVQNVFVHELQDDFPTTACITAINTNSVVNKRSGPGTNFEQMGSLTGDEAMAVIAQNTDSSGYIWWQLSDQSWVREDVAPVIGLCSNLPLGESD